MYPDRVPSVFSHKKAIPLSKLQAAANKNHHGSASKKSEILPDYMPLGIEEPSNADDINMIVDESIPVVKTEVTELK